MYNECDYCPDVAYCSVLDVLDILAEIAYQEQLRAEILLMQAILDILYPPVINYDDGCCCDDYGDDDYYPIDKIEPPLYDYDGPSEFNNKDDFPIKDYLKDIDRDELFKNNESYFKNW